jgi:iron only hydrogenase large subunit-like protein
MTDAETLVDLIQKKEKLVAMVAPSFIVMYEFPDIVTRLRSMGFQHVVEVAAGAQKTNEAVMDLLKANPTGRYITSPCASFVRFIRTRYPHFEKYLAYQADSPMIATAKLAHKTYPDHKLVFIGPCMVKKKEASEDHPDQNILVVTYRELEQVFQKLGLAEPAKNQNDTWDMGETHTRIYPYDGGLTETSGIRSMLKDDEIRIASGYKNCEAALKEFETNTKIRFVDILFCEGGCINGPGIASNLTLAERKKKVDDYASAV